jgi:carboxypeptidase family protein/SdrD B-like protein
LSEYLSRNPQPDFAIAGTVANEFGQPLPDSVITLTGSQSTSVISNAQGTFQFSNLPTSGIYTLTVNKAHYSFPNATYTFSRPDANVSANFTGLINRHSIHGRITKADGSAVSEVTVQLAQSPDSSIVTDDNGNYVFSNLAEGGTYTVVPASADFVFTPANQTFADLSADQTVNFVAQQTSFLLAGKVLDESDVAISGATVTLTGDVTASTVTDVQGNFRFRDLPTGGSYTVSVNKEHYSFAQNSQTLSNPLEDVIVEFSGSLNRHSISGRITRVNGNGIGGLTVQLGQSPATSVVTDANGYYSFTALAAGQNYAVAPSSSDFVFTPANKTFDDLAADITADFVGKIRPRIITADASDQAIALDSLSLMAGPFSILSSLGFSADGLTRLVIFASDVDTTELSQLSLVAFDDAGATYPLAIEQIDNVRDQSWMKQVNFKLSQSLPAGKCVWLRLGVGDVSSNDARICLSPR